MQPIKLSTDVKPNKATAFDTVLELRLQEGDIGPNTEKLDQLLNFFAPAIPAKPKTPFEWVAKAAGVKDVRQNLNSVYVENGTMVGCDGHRLHWAPTTLENGYYCPKTGLQVKDHGKYVDWKRVIPKTGKFIPLNDNPEESIKVTGKGKKLSWVDIIYDAIPEEKETGQFNVDYWKAATLNFDVKYAMKTEHLNSKLRHRIHGKVEKAGESYGEFVIISMDPNYIQ